MTPRRKRWIAVALAGVAAAVVTSLIVLSFPIAQAPSGYQFVNGRPYTFEAESLFGSASWLNYSYRGVTFTFHLWCDITADVGTVCGNLTESNGATASYAFSDGLPQLDPPWQTWVSPDGHAAVQYREGGLVHLLVAA